MAEAEEKAAREAMEAAKEAALEERFKCYDIEHSTGLEDQEQASPSSPRLVDQGSQKLEDELPQSPSLGKLLESSSEEEEDEEDMEEEVEGYVKKHRKIAKLP